MKKIKWNRVLAVLLAMVTAVSLLSACGSKSAEKVPAHVNMNRRIALIISILYISSVNIGVTLR